MILSKYDDFKKLTSTQKILNELLEEFNEGFLEKMKLNTTLRIKNFLIKHEIEVIDVIACYEDNKKSRPIIHHPHTFYDVAIKTIRNYLKTEENYSQYEYNEADDAYLDLLSKAIRTKKSNTKNLKNTLLDEIDKIYESINDVSLNNDFKQEIEVINGLKKKIVSNIKNTDLIF
jgi:hypothetical protein